MPYRNRKINNQDRFGIGGQLVDTTNNPLFVWAEGGGGGASNALQNSPEYTQAAIQNMNAQTSYMDQMRQNSGFGMNLNTFSNVTGGLASLGQLWQSHQASKLAKDQWKTQKSVLNTNMMNQIQSYNNSLKDRLDTRAHMEGRDQSSADAQYEERRARRH